MLQTGFFGCFGSDVDAIDYYRSEIEKIGKEVSYKICTRKTFVSFGPFKC